MKIKLNEMNESDSHSYMVAMVYNGDLALANSSNATLETLVNTTEQAETYEAFYHRAQFVTGVICYPIICILGLVGSFLILMVLSRKALHTSTNVYLRALAISDTFKLINDLLYFLTVLLLHTDRPAGQKMFAYLYPWAHYFMLVPVLVSSWLTVSVAVERYIMVCHATRARTLITVPRARVVCLSCFAILTLLAIPCALRYRTVIRRTMVGGRNLTEPDIELTELWKDEIFVTAYNWVLSLLRSIIPLLVIIVLNVFIINALRRTRANRRVAQRNKITVMLIIVTITFAVCITPDVVLSTFFNQGYAESASYLVRGVREITDMLLLVNSAVNFFIYITFNKVFRDQFILLFCPGDMCHQYVEKDETYRRLSEGRGVSHHSNGMALSKKTSAASTIEHHGSCRSQNGQTFV